MKTIRTVEEIEELSNRLIEAVIKADDGISKFPMLSFEFEDGANDVTKWLTDKKYAHPLEE